MEMLLRSGLYFRSPLSYTFHIHNIYTYVQTALASTDAFFLDELYGFLIGTCGAADELLSRDAPGLESYLARWVRGCPLNVHIRCTMVL